MRTALVCWRFVPAAMALASAAAMAQTTSVIPPSMTSTAGNFGNSIPLGNFAAGRYQMMFDSAALSAIPVGSVITGLQLRLRTPDNTNFPSAPLVITRYDVTLAQSNLTPATMSNTFANNMLNPVTVRSGSLSLAANAYTASATGSTPEAWGPLIPFTTPYIYVGGPLVVDWRVASASESGLHFADANLLPNPTEGSRRSASNPDAAISTNLDNSVTVLRLTYTPPTTPFQTGVTKMLVLDDAANTPELGTVTAVSTSQRALQAVIGAPEMRRLPPGSDVVGLSLRSASTASWPAAAASFAQFDLTLASALTTPATMSNTFASNMGPDATLVRSGALNLAAGVLAPRVGSRPAPWSWEIPFLTPFTFRGGPLAILLRHSGVSGGVSGQIDGIGTANPVFGVRVKGVFATTSGAASASSNAPVPIHRFSVDAGTVIPNANVSTAGAGALGDILRSAGDWTVQLILNASELTYLPVGSQINGLSLRADNTTFPLRPVVYANYNIDVSTSRNKPATASTTFANNEGADKLTVRSGPLSLLPGDLPFNATTGDFGRVIYFQRPFTYLGGDLCLTIRRSAASDTGALSLVDGMNDFSRVRQISGAGIAASTGALVTGSPIVRLSVVPSTVAPLSAAKTPGTIGYSLFFSSAGNVHQTVYGEDQLRGIPVGSLITGLSWRNQSIFLGFSSWPSAPVNVNRFDITLSTSPRTPSAMSDTFADNIGSDAILVRSGPITIPANAFPFRSSSTQPNDDVWFIPFAEPFVYRGGPLSLTFRNDSNAAGTNMFFDVTSNGAAGRWALGTGVDATTHSQGGSMSGLITRFVFVPRTYCPADLSNDAQVDNTDFVRFVQAYELLDCTDPTMPLGCPADLNFDTLVDNSDFLIFVNAYNELLCP